jgi:hypothetical protein
MSLILSGTDGLSDVDGTAATPAIRGTDTNTGIFFPAVDTIAFAEGGTEAMRIDSAGNVGIGTTTPTSSLVVAGTATGTPTVNGVHIGTQAGYATIEMVGTSGTGSLIDFTKIGSDAPGRILYDNTSNYMYIATNSVERMRIDSSGNLLVGTASTASYGAGIGRLYLSASGANWQVGPTSAFSNFYIKAGTGYGVGMTTTATSWSSDSDERVKTDLTPFENSLDKVCSLRAGTGKYLADKLNISRSFLIAQDVQKVLPEAVDVGEDENGTLQLRYTDLIPLLVASIKELNAKVDAQAAEIQALKVK